MHIPTPGSCLLKWEVGNRDRVTAVECLPGLGDAGQLWMRLGGSERRSKLPEAAQQWSMAPMDPELSLAPSFWWSGR